MTNPEREASYLPGGRPPVPDVDPWELLQRRAVDHDIDLLILERDEIKNIISELVPELAHSAVARGRVISAWAKSRDAAQACRTIPVTAPTSAPQSRLPPQGVENGASGVEVVQASSAAPVTVVMGIEDVERLIAQHVRAAASGAGIAMVNVVADIPKNARNIRRATEDLALNPGWEDAEQARREATSATAPPRVISQREAQWRALADMARASSEVANTGYADSLRQAHNIVTGVASQEEAVVAADDNAGKRWLDETWRTSAQFRGTHLAILAHADVANQTINSMFHSALRRVAKDSGSSILLTEKARLAAWLRDHLGDATTVTAITDAVKLRFTELFPRLHDVDPSQAVLPRDLRTRGVAWHDVVTAVGTVMTRHGARKQCQEFDVELFRATWFVNHPELREEITAEIQHLYGVSLQNQRAAHLRKKARKDDDG